MKTLIIILALGALLMWFAIPAHAQGAQCGDPQTIINFLKTKYGEKLFFIGQTSMGNTIKIFVNRKTGTWTSAIEGRALICIVASGQGMKIEKSDIDGTAI